jgi:hypothetical protein
VAPTILSDESASASTDVKSSKHNLRRRQEPAISQVFFLF